MKAIMTMLLLASMPIQAQTIYFNNANGMPIGTAQQMGNTTYYSNANGMPIGTAQQMGNTTYFNNANGMPAGTAQSSQPYAPQFTNPIAPLFPTVPLFPTSPFGR